MNRTIFQTAVILSLSLSLRAAVGEELPLLMPHLIAIQPPNVRQAWQQVSVLVAENEQLEQPQPEPFLARAELWTTAGNHEEAVEDYLRATNLLLAGKPSLVEQSRVLGLLRAALERLVAQPQALYPVQAASAFRAGIAFFNACQFEQAAPLLAEATRLNPTDAVYRAVRALNYRKLKDEDAANRQLATAASIIRRPIISEDELRGFHIRLERIQGKDRRWISAGIISAGLSQSDSRSEARQLLNQPASLMR